MILKMRSSKRGVLLSLGVLFLVIVTLACILYQKAREWKNSHHLARFKRAVVAANGHECAEIGKSILLKNGTAADAAIATLFCEGVTCPQCAGLGGGFLLTMYRRRAGKVVVLNAREVAPAQAHKDMFANETSKEGGLAVAVPGELRGYGALHKKYGRLPWADLVQPSIDLCNNGHVINKYLHDSLKSNLNALNMYYMASDFINPLTDSLYEVGESVVRPMLAGTLSTIAKEGPNALHSGTLTETFVNDARQWGSLITEQDMNDYFPRWLTPVQIPLSNNRTVYTTPLPGSGSVLAFMLHMLDGYAGAADAPHGSPVYWQRVVETFKYAFSWRSALGDTAVYTVHREFIQRVAAEMQKSRLGREHRRFVNDYKTSNFWNHYGATYSSSEDHGTTHVVVISPEGDVISVTSSINSPFGATRISRSTGIYLNNQMDDFSIPSKKSWDGMLPSPVNYVEPGRQPLSSMVPSIVLDENGLPVLAVGAAGGTRITTQVAQIVLGTILEGARFTDVMKRPRLHHQLVPMAVQYERDFDPGIIKSLRLRGHITLPIDEEDESVGAVVGAALDTSGYYVPHTDRHRPGSVAGF